MSLTALNKVNQPTKAWCKLVYALLHNVGVSFRLEDDEVSGWWISLFIWCIRAVEMLLWLFFYQVMSGISSNNRFESIPLYWLHESGVAGLTHIITMDLHQKEIQGFFSFPVDNLRASPFLIQYIQEEVRLRYAVDRHKDICPLCQAATLSQRRQLYTVHEI